jgi:hypothetical protein
MSTSVDSYRLVLAVHEVAKNVATSWLSTGKFAAESFPRQSIHVDLATSPALQKRECTKSRQFLF